MDEKSSSSNLVSESPINVAARKFAARHREASKDLLEHLFEIGNDSLTPDKVDKNAAEVRGVLSKVDHAILLEYLERADCPHWLGIWTAKRGLAPQQIAYLFRPGMSKEPPISDRIASRPADIRRLFWRSKSAFVVSTLLKFDDDAYLAWAKDIGFNRDIGPPNLDPKEGETYVAGPKSQIDSWLGSALDPIIDSLWKLYVPKQGACTVLQGELARCIVRLEGEYWNNGMMNMGGGSYDRMVDKIKDTALSDDSFSPLIKRIVRIDASIAKGADYAKIVRISLLQESDVELSLRRLKSVVAAWCLRHVEPIPYEPMPWD